MTALEAKAADAAGSRLADMSPCPGCGELLIGPASSTYLGLGRIEHTWRCDACGGEFHTKSRLAGIVEAPSLTEAEASSAGG